MHLDYLAFHQIVEVYCLYMLDSNVARQSSGADFCSRDANQSCNDDAETLSFDGLQMTVRQTSKGQVHHVQSTFRDSW